MAKLPPLKRLLNEDFKDIPEVTPILQVLNTLTSAMNSAFNKNITIENINSNIITFVYANSTTAGNGFKAGLKSTPKVVHVGKVTPLDAATLSGPVFLNWTYLPDQDRISIDSAYGLDTADGKYEITVQIFGG
jgi:hypothetical protein